MKSFLTMLDGVLIILFFITAFSFALALVLWLVGILGVSVWSLSKTFLAMVISFVLAFSLEELMKKLDV